MLLVAIHLVSSDVAQYKTVKPTYTNVDFQNPLENILVNLQQ